MTPAIKVDNLFKYYDDVPALKGISFKVAPGTICGLLGANGAGKTTTLAILLGLLTPSSGAIEILGQDFLADRYAVLSRMNFSSPYVDLPQRLTVQENLDIYARLYGVADRNGRINRLCEELELSHFRNRAYATLSAGQRTRVALVKALINEPELLLLDEPTASMDPDTADRVRHYLCEYRDQTGATILFSSHNMNEVERICDQALIMHTGDIVNQGPPVDMVAAYGRRTLEEVFLDVVRHSTVGRQAHNGTGQA